MPRLQAIAALFSLLVPLLAPTAPLAAQTIDVVGGTATAPSRSNLAKANLFQVDTSVVLLDAEMFLDVPGVETLTFFVYRHHSRAGIYTLEFTTSVTVNGTGVGPAWYGPGSIAVPMLCGNHYLIGVSWPGTLTYHYSTSTAGSPVSFGNWQTGRTPANPLPASLSVPAGTDVAQYRQRLTTAAIPAVTCVGTGCSSTATAPRLLTTGIVAVGAQAALEIFGATPGVAAIYGLSLGPPLAAPLPLLGCDLWLNPAATANILALVDGQGHAVLPLSVPANPGLAGVQLSVQAGILSSPVSLTNALGLQL